MLCQFWENLLCLSVLKTESAEVLLTPLTQIYEAECYSDKHLKLFHRTFLLQLCSCFGMEVFLRNFSTLLIEAIGGWKSSKICANESTIRTHLTSFDIIELNCADNVMNKPSHQIRVTRSESEVSYVGESSSNNTQHQIAEPEMFLMEPDFSDSEGNDNSSSHSIGSMNLLSSPSKKSVQSSSGDTVHNPGSLLVEDSKGSSCTGSAQGKIIYFFTN